MFRLHKEKYPVFVIYTDRFIPKDKAGYCFGFLVFIRKRYRDDICLLQHELTHVEQFYKTLGFALLLWNLNNIPLIKKISDYVIFKHECEAYARQLYCCMKRGYDFNRTLEYFVDFVYNRYGLDKKKYTKQRIKEEILRKYSRIFQKESKQ
jgi:hypothetical protein